MKSETYFLIQVFNPIVGKYLYLKEDWGIHFNKFVHDAKKFERYQNAKRRVGAIKKSKRLNGYGEIRIVKVEIKVTHYL